MDGREIVKLGVNFSSETRTIDAWERGEWAMTNLLFEHY
jgi:hypothetical protein